MNETPDEVVRDLTFFPASGSGQYYVAAICPRCGATHRLEQCPQVKAIEYHVDGRTIRRVEFHEGYFPGPPIVTATGDLRGRDEARWYKAAAETEYLLRRLGYGSDLPGEAGSSEEEE